MNNAQLETLRRAWSGLVLQTGAIIHHGRENEERRKSEGAMLQLMALSQQPFQASSAEGMLAWLLPLVIVLPLVGFWLWMYRDMSRNERLPDSAPLMWPPASKYNWTLAFIVLNVFGAAFYYVLEYRNRH